MVKLHNPGCITLESNARTFPFGKDWLKGGVVSGGGDIYPMSVVSFVLDETLDWCVEVRKGNITMERVATNDRMFCQRR